MPCCAAECGDAMRSAAMKSSQCHVRPFDLCHPEPAVIAAHLGAEATDPDDDPGAF